MSEIKPVLRQMIDNNKPHWRPETIRGAHKMLDEYEAKAEAFDRIVEQRMETGVITLGHHAWHIIQKYESGEYDAKK